MTNNFNLINNNISKISIDYIVEQGTSGDWYYRKYASGWAELWAYKTSSLTTIAGQSSAAHVSLNYPFALTSQPKYFASFGVNYDAFCWLTYVGANTEKWKLTAKEMEHQTVLHVGLASTLLENGQMYKISTYDKNF